MAFNPVDQSIPVRVDGSDWVSDFVADGIDTPQPGANTGPVAAFSYPLDTFEYTEIPSWSPWDNGSYRYLWEVDEDDNAGRPRPQSRSIGVGEGIFGANKSALLVDVQESDHGAGGAFPMFVNWHGNDGGYWFVRESAQWTQLQRINRFRLWVWAPEGQNVAGDNRQNVHVGTYLMESARDPLGESNNWHFYHYFSLEHTGSWMQLIVDNHPSHQRGANGNTEHGVLAEPEPGYGYFDLMSWFYFKNQNANTIDPHQVKFDGFEFYEAPAEDVDHIYSLQGTYTSGGEVFIKFSCRKDQTNDTFDVRYAFSSFHDNGGFVHGSAAPSGTGIECSSGQVPSGYNFVTYRTSAIDVAGQDAIYIAIQHQDEPTLFREIRIPIAANAFPNLPATTPLLTQS